ncbi:MAG: hypothetical protein Q8Q20_04405 [bacterium]|nr:hypothetical protein [bacterium]
MMVNWKKKVYVAFSILLGILLSLLAHAGIEALYLGWADANNQVVTWYGGCSLHPFIQAAIFVLGAVGGFFLGLWWWRIVYIEKRHWHKNK